MDYRTKMLQKPLEKVFGEICNHFDCEVISVPANKRLAKIHEKFFNDDFSESEEYVKVMSTLDCTRWGPESQLNK